jgi:DNA-binding NtrC family response regulator
MLKGFRIALVEDDEIMGSSIVQRLELEGAEVLWLKQITRALGAIRTPHAPIDVVICDIRLPDGTGEELFNTLCTTTIPPPFLFITGHGGIEQAVRLIQAGATDYITKPFEMKVFLERLVMLLAPQTDLDMPTLLGVSAAAQRIEKLALKAAQEDRPVLIIGPPGIGKSLVAQRIHEASERCAAPFITVNLAREPDIEQALFGLENIWEKTGEGVLYIHAIDRLPDAVIPQVLNAISSGFRGRIIATCGPEMPEVIARVNKRADFFYRLNMIEITVPSLGQRTEDAVWLMRQVFDRLNAKRAVPLRGISHLCDDAVHGHTWPGGGRELRARVQRGLENAEGPLLQPLDLFPENAYQRQPVLSLNQARETAERTQITNALTQTNGQIGKAAALLKVSRTTLWDKMQKLGIHTQ